MQNARQLADIYHGFVAMLADGRREFGGDGGCRLHEKPRLSKRRQQRLVLPRFHHPNWSKLCACLSQFGQRELWLTMAACTPDFGLKDIAPIRTVPRAPIWDERDRRIRPT
jgi:hypothetical protein